ncbi:MAG: hypothetical protein QG573_321 [Acidobacteriota bacterium]|nr:hypothetical protein [Acidobacteriota bacterium]
MAHLYLIEAQLRRAVQSEGVRLALDPYELIPFVFASQSGLW